MNKKIEFHDSLGYICTSIRYINVSEGIKRLTELAQEGELYVAGRGHIRPVGKIRGFIVK
jgi:hypothetical protein